MLATLAFRPALHEVKGLRRLCKHKKGDMAPSTLPKESMHNIPIIAGGASLTHCLSNTQLNREKSRNEMLNLTLRHAPLILKGYEH